MNALLLPWYKCVSKTTITPADHGQSISVCFHVLFYLIILPINKFMNVYFHQEHNCQLNEPG